MVNGKRICSGPPLDIKRVRILRTINLQHTLSLALTPDTAGAFHDNNNHYQFGFDSSNSYNNNIKENQTLPNQNGNGSFSKFGVANAVNHYPGNPFFSFSTTEKSPNRITYYKDNQFFNIPTSAHESLYLNVFPTTTATITTTRPFVQKKPDPTNRKPVNHYPGNPFFSFSTTDKPPNRITCYKDNPFFKIPTHAQENPTTTTTTTTRPFVQKKSDPTTRKPFNHYPGNPFFSFSTTEKPYNSIIYYKHNPFFNIPTNAQENSFLNVLPTTTTTTTTTTTRPFVQKRPDPTTRKHVRANLNKICGKSLSTTSLIAHGTPVAEEYYPWLVSLYNIEQLNFTFTCGGSLVSEKHIITAAHCLRTYENKVNIDELFMILGKNNIQRWTNDEDSLILSAETI